MTTALARRIVAGQQVRIATPLPGPTPPATLLQRHGVDVSNYTDRFGLQTVLDWRDNYDIGLVIVQSLDSERFPQSRTVQQLITCQAADMPVDLYVYPFFANGVEDCARRLAEGRKAGVPIRRVWLDVEDVDPSQRSWTPAQRADMLRRWLVACDGYPGTVARAGIYTGRWYWASPDYLANSTAFADRDLWDSDYDGIEDVDASWTPYGGWTRREIKQYRGSGSLGGIGGVDLNVLSEAERARV